MVICFNVYYHKVGFQHGKAGAPITRSQKYIYINPIDANFPPVAVDSDIRITERQAVGVSFATVQYTHEQVGRVDPHESAPLGVTYIFGNMCVCVCVCVFTRNHVNLTCRTRYLNSITLRDACV